MAASSDKFLEKVDDELVTCSICMEQYDKPKILPCLHTFCLKCLEDYVKKKGISNCPTCTAPFGIPTRGLSELKANSFMNSLIDLVVERRKLLAAARNEKCELCDDGDISHVCQNCSEFICGVCAKSHVKSKASRSHTVTTIDEHRDSITSRQSVAEQTVNCSVHEDNKVKFYCDTCQVPVCVECTVVDHRVPEHAHRNLKDAASEYRKQLEIEFQQLKIKEKEADDSRTAIKHKRAALQRKCREEQQKVDKKAEEIIAAIRDEQNKLSAELTAEYNTRLKRLNVQQDDFDLKHGNIVSTCEYVETLTTHGNVAHVLLTKNEVTSRVKELLSSDTKYKEELDIVEFKPFVVSQDKHFVGVLKSDVSVSHCSIDSIPKKIGKGKSVTVNVITRDYKGCKVIPRQALSGTIKSPSNKVSKLHIKNNLDGSHSVTISEDVLGRHRVELNIDGKHIPGTPRDVTVITKGLFETVGKHGDKEGEFNYPWGLAYDKYGNLVTADRDNHRIQVFDSGWRCKKVLTFTQFKNAFKPQGIAISDDNTYFMTDCGNQQVVVCDENGHVIRCFGQNELNNPIGIALHHTDGNVYVCSRRSGKVEVYTQNGKHIRTLGSQSSGQVNFKAPSFIAVDRAGRLYVTDFEHCCVYVCDVHGKQILKSERLDMARGVCIHNDRTLFVTVGNKLYKLDMYGKIVSRIDCDSDGLVWPTCVVLSDDSPQKLIVANTHAHCIEVFVE
ncbi:E3 ubiquitin-protein ligase TRIM71-like [Glandiceps talaboti]